MKFDDNGVYIPVTDDEERLVPWAPYNRTLESIKEARSKVEEIPKAMRWLVKRAMKEMSNEEYAVNSLTQMIVTVESVGGKIEW